MRSGTALNQWNLGRIAVIGGCVLGLAACNQPKSAKQYYGVHLGMSMNEVAYVLGSPSMVLGPAQRVTKGTQSDEMRALLNVSEIPQGKTIDDYPAWDWDNSAYDLVVVFNKVHGKSIKVRCIAQNDSPTSCKPLLGITIGTIERSLKKKLGTPSRQALHNTIFGVSKTIEYDQLDASFDLEKQKVIEIQFGGLGMPHP